jgi:hypothetical protein
MSTLDKLLHRSVTGLVRLACMLTLAALGIMVYSVVVPKPMPIILAMSVGHLVGASGFACFFLAVVIDAGRSRRRSSLPPVGTRE